MKIKVKSAAELHKAGATKGMLKYAGMQGEWYERDLIGCRLTVDRGRYYWTREMFNLI